MKHTSGSMKLSLVEATEVDFFLEEQLNVNWKLSRPSLPGGSAPDEAAIMPQKGYQIIYTRLRMELR